MGITGSRAKGFSILPYFFAREEREEWAWWSASLHLNYTPIYKEKEEGEKTHVSFLSCIHGLYLDTKTRASLSSCNM